MKWLDTGREQAAIDLSERLQRELSGSKDVLWLLSGGSNIATATRIMNLLPDDLTSHLTVSLVDERYGPIGHVDSNWGQLQQAGFPAKQARMLPVLHSDMGFEQTRDSYETMLKTSLANGNSVIALLGMGDDGHIAGILPHTIATEPTEALIVAYHHQPYDRLTLSFSALQALTATYTFVFGESKKPPLTRLSTENLPLAEQPAQILKYLEDAYVYNDQVEEKL